jgi:hypothetical protein
MKDLPHHIRKLNRKVIRSLHRLEEEEANYDSDAHLPPLPHSEKQLKKQAKARIRNAKKEAPLDIPTPDQRNRNMKKRTPVFDRWNFPRPKGRRPL